MRILCKAQGLCCHWGPLLSPDFLGQVGRTRHSSISVIWPGFRCSRSVRSPIRSVDGFITHRGLRPELLHYRESRGAEIDIQVQNGIDCLGWWQIHALSWR